MNKNTKAKHTNPNDITILNSNENNVYCYTFACPNNFYKVDNTYERESKAIPTKKIHMDYTNPHSVRYRCIFNIVNDDDFVPKLPMEECKWTKYGRVAKKSIEKDIVPSISSIIAPIQKGHYYKYAIDTYKTSNYRVKLLISELVKVYSYSNNMRNSTYSYNKNGKEIGTGKINLDLILKTNENGIPYQKMKVNMPIKIDKIPFFDIPINIDFDLNISVDSVISNYQNQMLAYFLQSIAHCLHTYVDDDSIAKWASSKFQNFIFSEENMVYIVRYENKEYNLNQAIFKFTEMANEYKQAQSKLIDTAEYMEYPHYLESYYTISKEISIKDFN